MHKNARNIFVIILIVYLYILFSVAHVDIYLTYIAIPILVVLGLIIIFTKSKKHISDQDNKSPPSTSHKLNSGISSARGISDFLNECDAKLKKLENDAIKFNAKHKLASDKRRQELKREFEQLTPEQKKYFDNLNK